MDHVWLSFLPIKDLDVRTRFPHIYERCLEEGYDITKDWIPVVPAQHYFMGGVDVDLCSRTSMNHLYAAGETCCNGVHGANRLASNSLLESLVFAESAAKDIVAKRLASVFRSIWAKIWRFLQRIMDWIWRHSGIWSAIWMKISGRFGMPSLKIKRRRHNEQYYYVKNTGG